MVDTVSNDRVHKLRQLHCVKAVALIYHESTINCIKSMYKLSKRVFDDPNLVPDFLIIVGDLGSLWDTFLTNN